MTNRRSAFLLLAWVATIVIASTAISFAAHHSLMMNNSYKSHEMVSDKYATISTIQLNKICDVAQSAIVPLAKNVLSLLALVPPPDSLGSILITFTFLLLTYLKSVLRRPPKLYLAYSVFRI
jgi:hypothetical protein